MLSKNLFVAVLIGSVFYSSNALAQLLISYDFESVDIAAGPDTFELFERTGSDVSVSSLYAFSGQHSLHIRDIENNGAFAEFQGYFPEQSSRQVDIHFALMTPKPSEAFNFAVAGSGHFNFSKNGHFFWLANDGEFLYHVSNGVRKKIAPIPAYEWLLIDATLDLDNSSYSLEILSESGERLVSLKDQISASNRPGSNVRKYSFISDLRDSGSADYFVDDFSMRLYTDAPVNDFIAPGRRDLFIDMWQKYYRQVEEPKHCLPTIVMTDFVYEGDDFSLNILKQNRDLLRTLLSKPSLRILNDVPVGSELIQGIVEWAKGCAYLRKGQAANAVERFESSQRLIGNVPAVQLATSIALAQTDRVYSSEAIISYHKAQWSNDARWNVAQAMVGFLSYQENTAEQALVNIASYLRGSGSESIKTLIDAGWLTESAALKARRELVWSEALQFFMVAEQYYFALLWQEKYQLASDYAEQILSLLSGLNYQSPVWEERLADAALMGHDLYSAEKNYLSILKYSDLSYWSRISVSQKLSDVYFLQNLPEKERETREAIFGTLNLE